MEREEDSWGAWRNYVLAELKRSNENDDNLKLLCERMTIGLSHVEIQLAELKIKASIWGALAGLIPAIGILLLSKLK